MGPLCPGTSPSYGGAFPSKSQECVPRAEPGPEQPSARDPTSNLFLQWVRQTGATSKPPAEPWTGAVGEDRDVGGIALLSPLELSARSHPATNGRGPPRPARGSSRPAARTQGWGQLRPTCLPPSQFSPHGPAFQGPLRPWRAHSPTWPRCLSRPTGRPLGPDTHNHSLRLLTSRVTFNCTRVCEGSDTNNPHPVHSDTCLLPHPPQGP